MHKGYAGESLTKQLKGTIRPCHTTKHLNSTGYKQARAFPCGIMQAYVVISSQPATSNTWQILASTQRAWTRELNALTAGGLHGSMWHYKNVERQSASREAAVAPILELESSASAACNWITHGMQHCLLQHGVHRPQSWRWRSHQELYAEPFLLSHWERNTSCFLATLALQN